MAGLASVVATVLLSACSAPPDSPDHSPPAFALLTILPLSAPHPSPPASHAEPSGAAAADSPHAPIDLAPRASAGPASRTFISALDAGAPSDTDASRASARSPSAPTRLWRLRDDPANAASPTAWRTRRVESDPDVDSRPPNSPDARPAPDPRTLSEEFFSLAPDGSVLLSRTIEHADAVVTHFQPPIPVVPSRAVPGVPLKFAFDMIVRPIDRPDQIKTRGPAELELTLLGFDRVTTPAGAFDCAHLRSVIRATLGSAKVTVTTDSWLSDTLGLVAEDARERVTVFGVPIRSARRLWALESAAEADRPPLPPALPAAP